MFMCISVGFVSQEGCICTPIYLENLHIRVLSSMFFTITIYKSFKFYLSKGIG